MKNKFLIFSVVVSTVVFLGILPYSNHVFAINGCCKERENKQDQSWYANGLDYKKCVEENKKRDRDKVFSKSGNIWWDKNC